jgi:hypothetical protein
MTVRTAIDNYFMIFLQLNGKKANSWWRMDQKPGKMTQGGGKDQFFDQNPEFFKKIHTKEMPYQKK